MEGVKQNESMYREIPTYPGQQVGSATCTDDGRSQMGMLLFTCEGPRSVDQREVLHV